MKKPSRLLLALLLFFLPSATAQQQPKPTSASSQTQSAPKSSTPAFTKSWSEPAKIVDLDFERIPIEEIAPYLKREFDNHFDILLPFGHEENSAFNWKDTVVTLRLRKVTASEIFNAMNLVFESAGTPLQWELLMNGRRPTALLRPLPHLLSRPADSSPEKPKVFFIGDLVGDPKSGGMTLDQVVQTVAEVCQSALGQVNISTHKEAQLLVVRGTSAQITFVQDTLSALRAKTQADDKQQQPEIAAEPKPKGKEQTDR